MTFAAVALAQSAKADEPVGPAIGESKITALQARLAEADKGASSVRRRMACKSVIREGQALLEASPAAADRYPVLGIVFQAQKRLTGLENSARNRDALFDTCEKLSKAPDAHAGLRLEADLLLSDRDLTAKNATMAQRAEALDAIVDRYRGTPAEAKSLMMAALIAPKLEAFELEQKVFDALSERFADDPRVIEFIQRNLGVRRLDVLFCGAFARADGTVLHFPNDRLGHLCLMVFWSRQSPDFEQYLGQVKELAAKYPDRFDIFSFNLDELPDAGEAILRGLGLNWTVMRLPGGRKGQTYRTYIQKDPLGIMVNAYGHVVLAPMVVRKEKFKLEDARISEDRYLTQLQSLFIGDYLVTDAERGFDPAAPAELKMVPMGANARAAGGVGRTAESVPADTLRAIQACFIAPPFRYRLTSAEALANYAKAEKLCRDAIAQHPKAPDLWLVRNRRIIALLGMWNLADEPKHLDLAAKEARAALAEKLPAGAAVVPRFCLAKEAIRKGDSDPNAILSELIGKTDGAHAPCSAVAAASILAMEVNSRDLHDSYRDALLKAGDGGNPMLWPVASFLRDRYCTYHLFKGNYIRSEDRGLRSYVVANHLVPVKDRLPKLEFKGLDGKAVSLPKDTDGRQTILLFVEPPADASETKLTRQAKSVFGYAKELTDCYVHKDEINVVAAFLCDDAKRVDAVMKANGLTCRAVMVPGGLANPLVRRLGILAADRVPNAFLIRRDGTIAWSTSGLSYKAEFGYPFAVRLALKVHVEISDLETACEDLKQANFRKALHYFADPYLPDKDQRFSWAGPRLHGRTLAHMGLKAWDKALADIDAAIVAHQQAFDDLKKGPCEVVAEMRLVRATILDHLGRGQEAEAERKKAAVATTPHSPTPYGLYHAELKKIRLSTANEWR